MNDATTLLPDIKLRFNIEHPNLEDCYVFGYQCAQNEVNEEENPFRDGTQEHEYWAEGWWAGFYGEEPIFDVNSGLAEDEMTENAAANDQSYHYFHFSESFLATVIKITGALAATAVVGYQVLDLVA